MFKKLFGSSSGGGEAKKPAQQQVDPHETMDKLSLQIETVQKRANKIEADMKNLV